MPNYKEPPKRRGRPPLPKDKNGKAIHKKTDDQVYTCSSCGGEFVELQGNFVTSDSPLFYGLGGYVPICRECLAKHFNKVVLPAFDDDVYKAIEYMCGLLDWYYDERIVETAIKLVETNRANGGNKPAIIFYGERRTMQQYKKAGSTYLDKCKQRLAAEHEVQEELEFEVEPEPVNDEDVLLFGPGYTSEEYRYMRSEFNEWKERYNCETKAQEEIFKNIVIAQVNVRRAQEQGEQKRTTEAVKSLNELMASAKVQPKQKTETALVDQNTFGTLIQKWENEEPIPATDPELEDVDGIKKYINTWFFGHLSKMFGLDNDSAREYEEEVAKYTVEPPQYHGDEDDSADSVVSQKLKAMRGRGAAQEDAEDGDQ